jgi:multiple sugar transport system permease protein
MIAPVTSPRRGAPRSRGLVTALVYLVLTVAAVAVVAPVVWLFLTSLKTPLNLFALNLPLPPSLDSYRSVLADQPVLTYLRNSVIVAVCATTASVTLAVLAAFGFTRYPFPGSGPVFISVLVCRMVPGIALIIPLYLIFGRLGLLDTLQGLIIAHTAYSLPFAIWLLEGFIRDIPHDLDDAGLIDGCNPLSVLLRIILPVAAPGLAVAAIFSFLLSWNDFIVALILTSTPASQTMPVGLSHMTLEYGVRWDQLSAAGMMYIVPTLIMAIALQRYIVRGLTLGAVKG